MTEAVRRPSRLEFYRRWTLRRRVGRWFLALVVLLVLAFTSVLFSLFYFRSKGDEVINRWQPASSLCQTLLSDLVNQETGLRGYVIGKKDVFLEPYRTYGAKATADDRSLRALLNDHPALLDQLDRFDQEAAVWRGTIAEPYIERVRRGDPTASTLVTDLAGKDGFDRVRAAAATLSASVTVTRDDAKAARTTAMTYSLIAVVVAACLTLGSKYVLWRGLQRTVLDPIDALATQSREVAQGAISRRITPSGPPELAGLGRDVDMMRARIANELSRVERSRARLEERSADLARSNADLEQFAYVASHDLSEPLRKVANFCQLLERQYGDQLDDKAKQYIAFAVDGAKRMQVLIGDLLAFSRVGRSADEFVELDLEVVLSRALATLDDRIEATGAEIVRGPMPTLHGDATLLSALFQNLVGNALKYRSEERVPRVEITAARQGSEWLFTISDNGIGIERQYAERIFTIFQRLHLRDQYGGTGIGLALCRKIVEFHRGRIWLAEHQGPAGATFQFSLPEHVKTRDAVDADEQ